MADTQAELKAMLQEQVLSSQVNYSGDFVLNKDGLYEVLDGQQRITSFARFVNHSWAFAVEWAGKPEDDRAYAHGRPL